MNFIRFKKFQKQIFFYYILKNFRISQMGSKRYEESFTRKKSDEERIATKRTQYKKDVRSLRKELARKTFLELGVDETIISNDYIMKLKDEEMDQISMQQFQQMIEAQKTVYRVLLQAQVTITTTAGHEDTEVNEQDNLSEPIAPDVQDEEEFKEPALQSIQKSRIQDFSRDEEDEVVKLPPINVRSSHLKSISQLVAQNAWTDTETSHQAATVLGKRSAVPSLQLTDDNESKFNPLKLYANSNSPNHYQLMEKDKKSSTELEMTAPKTKTESQIRSKTVELKNTPMSPEQKNITPGGRQAYSEKKNQMRRKIAKDYRKKLAEIADAEKEKEKRNKKAKERRARMNKKSSHSPLKKLGSSGPEFGVFGKLINKITGSSKAKAKKGNNEKLSFKQLNKMITTLHPTDPETHERLPLGDSVTVSKYGLKLVDAIGCLHCLNACKCCVKWFRSCLSKRPQKHYIKPDTMKDVPDSESDSDANDTFKGLSSGAVYLGEGAVIYLQMMKTFAILFFVLTILNVPLYLMYSSMTEGNDYSSFSERFKYFTIGNIGKGNTACAYSSIDFETSQAVYPVDPIPEILNPQTEEMELQYPEQLSPPNQVIFEKALQNKERNLQLKCPGSSYIESIEDLGFMYLLDPNTESFSSASRICHQITHPLEKYAESEQSEEWHELLGKMSLRKSIQPNATTHNIDSSCNLKNLFRSPDDKKQFMTYFNEQCKWKNNCTIEPEGMPHHFSSLISNQCYSRIFNQQISSIEYIIVTHCMSDEVQMPYLEIKFHKLHLGTYAVMTDIISILIVYYIFNKLKDINLEYQEIMDNNIIIMSRFAIRINNVRLDKTMQDSRILKMKTWLHFQKILQPFMTQDNKMEVADVQISNSTTPKFFYLLKLSEFQIQINEVSTRLKSGQLTYREQAYYGKQLVKLQQKIVRFKEKFDKILEKEKQLNKAVIHISKHVFIPKIDYIWVVFKNNQTTKTIYKLHEKEHPVQLLCKRMLCIKDEQSVDTNSPYKQIEKQPLEPDQILWQNLTYTEQDQSGRQFIVFLISIIVAILSIALTLFVEGQSMNLQKYEVDCEGVSTNIEDVYRHQMKFMLQQTTLAGSDEIPVQLSESMICFCQDPTNGGLAMIINSKPFKAEGQKVPDKNNYCAMYIKIFMQQQMVAALREFSTVIINALIATLFGLLGKFLMMHTTIEQNLNSFKYIIILEYFNMSVIILLQSFDPTGISNFIMGTEENFVVYEGFNSAWYLQRGYRLCFTIWLSSWLTNVTEFKQMCKVFARRFHDRGYKLNIKKDVEDEGDDEPNSKKKVQEDLEELYTGEEFKGETAYSRMMSILMVCLTYSSGIPILYLVGFLQFLITYVVMKTMLFKYYRKTNTLSRVTPNFSVKFLNVAILVHMIVGCIMFTNPSLFQVRDPPAHDFPKFPFLTLTQEEMEKETPIMQNVYKRVQNFHEQLYLVFVACAIALFISGKFIAGLLHLVWIQIKALAAVIYAKIKKALSSIGKFIGSSARAIGRACCPKRIEQLEKDMERRAKIKSNKRLQEQIRAKIDYLWIQYDRDNSKCLDVEETRELVKDLLIQLNKADSYSDKIFDLLFEEFDRDESGTLEKPEMLHMMNQLLGLEQFRLQSCNTTNVALMSEPDLRRDQSQVELESLDLEGPQHNHADNQAYDCQDKQNHELIRKFQADLIKDAVDDTNNPLVMTQEEKMRQEQILAKFKMQILQPYKSANIYMELNISNLIQMYEKSLKELDDIKGFFNIRSESDAKVVLTPPLNRRMKKHELRMIFEELCYTQKLTFKEVHLFLDMLQTRIKDIEEVIDKHFELIKDVIYKNKADQIQRDKKKMQGKEKTKAEDNFSARPSSLRQGSKSKNAADGEMPKLEKQIEENMIQEKLQNDPDLQFDNPMIYTYPKKLKMLEFYEEDLIKKDKMKKENRRGIQTICRLQGSIAQSYFMIDQHQFRVARKIYYGQTIAGEVNDASMESSQLNILQQKYHQNVQTLPNEVIVEQAEEDRESSPKREQVQD